MKLRMKKGFFVCICFFLLLSGCGNAVNTTQEQETTGYSWEQASDFQENKGIFNVNDIKENTNEYTYWKNDEAEASLEYIDNCYYLSFKSKKGSITKKPIDFIMKNKQADTLFYEFDANSDGKDDLVISYTYSTGTESLKRSVCCISNYQDTIMYYDNAQFTEAQKEDIVVTFDEWNKEGFKDVTNIVLNKEALSVEYFNASVVQINNSNLVLTKILLPKESKNDRSNKITIYVLFDFKDNILSVNKVWCDKR